MNSHLSFLDENVTTLNMPEKLEIIKSDKLDVSSTHWSQPEKDQVVSTAEK